MSDSPLHVIFSGGATGGHLFPGLAVAETLRRSVPDARITFTGGGRVWERSQVAAAGCDYLTLPCRPAPRRVREVVPFVYNALAGVRAARRFLAEHPADVVVGLGGYASVPMARAAIRRRTALVLLEQNTMPGRATRWLAPRATLVCIPWATTRAHLRCRGEVRVTGTPIRPPAPGGWGKAQRCPSAPGLGLRCAQPPATRPSRRNRLLVLGGSGGAAALNENVPKALYKLRSRLAGWQLVHQSGRQGLEATRELYRKLALEATVVEFIAEMPRMLAATDLAVCRSGGSTLAELAAEGVPAVLVPYPHAKDDHQRHNAALLGRTGGAILLDEREPSARLDDRMACVLSRLVDDAAVRRRMSAAMRRLGKADAAIEVTDAILDVASAALPQARRRAA